MANGRPSFFDGFLFTIPNLCSVVDFRAEYDFVKWNSIKIALIRRTPGATISGLRLGAKIGSLGEKTKQTNNFAQFSLENCQFYSEIPTVIIIGEHALYEFFVPLCSKWPYYLVKCIDCQNRKMAAFLSVFMKNVTSISK